jgi:hypothetical protein
LSDEVGKQRNMFPKTFDVLLILTILRVGILCLALLIVASLIYVFLWKRHRFLLADFLALVSPIILFLLIVLISEAFSSEGLLTKVFGSRNEFRVMMALLSIYLGALVIYAIKLKDRWVISMGLCGITMVFIVISFFAAALSTYR